MRADEPQASDARLGRGERVLPGLWRLRLPLPWPGVPHCNAWAIAAGSGIVLVDTGMHQPGSLAQLERALEQVRPARSSTSGCWPVTHAHSDHWGQAAPIVDRAGCELWMHPNHEHATRRPTTRSWRWPGGSRWAARAAFPRPRSSATPSALREMPSGIARGDRARPATWSTACRSRPTSASGQVYETPGHAPSHVCLFQPERRLLISGDHLLGRISLYYDYGWTPDPVGRVPGARSMWSSDSTPGCACPATGKPFVDVPGHIEGNRALVAERLEAVIGRWRASRGPPRSSSPGDLTSSRSPSTNAPLAAAPRRSATCNHLERAGQRSLANRAADGAGTGWQLRNLDTILSRLVACAAPCASTRSSPDASEPVFSFEFFPPKTDEGERNLRAALEALRRSSPTSPRSPTAPAARPATARSS